MTSPVRPPQFKHSFIDLARQNRVVTGEHIHDQVVETHRALDEIIAELTRLRDQQVAQPQLKPVALSITPAQRDFRQQATIKAGAGEAESWSVASWHWAEYLDGPVPADTCIMFDVHGDHWSSRYWANAAAQSADDAENAAVIAESFNDYYLGPWPAPPITDNDGNPLEEGALYFDTSLDQMRVWTGTAWVAGPATMTYAAVDILSNPSGDVAATNVQAAINELAAEKATKAEVTAAFARVQVSDSAPSSPVTGHLWFDSNNGRLFVFVDSFWVQIKGN